MEEENYGFQLPLKGIFFVQLENMQCSFAGWWFCLGDMTVFECLVFSSQIVHEENFAGIRLSLL